MLFFLAIFTGTSARSWSDWMKAWGKRTWLCMWEEITCLSTPTGSCIARAQRTWRIGCKAPLPFHQACVSPQFRTTQPVIFRFLSIAGTLCLKGRRARMPVACWGNGTWSSPGRCSTPCMPCFALRQVTGSPIPSTPHPIVTLTTSATSSLWVAWWPRQSMITGYWSATSLAASTSTSWARVSGILIIGSFQPSTVTTLDMFQLH